MVEQLTAPVTPPAVPTPGALLSVRDLTVEIDTDHGVVRPVTAVDFDVHAGEFVCIVGESGSGKSVTLLTLMGLLPTAARVSAGAAHLGQHDLLRLQGAERRAVIGSDISIVFQDPGTSLNPLMRVGVQVAEMIRVHDRSLSRARIWERVVELFDIVGIPSPATRIDDYPHQFSGGMRQRVMIAIAIANNPRVLLADEPTTALDVTVQAQVLDALQRAREVSGATIVMVTHDLGVVAETADRVLVMYAGRVAETAPVSELFHRTKHRYTAALLACQPRIDGPIDSLVPIPGSPPNMTTVFAGCAFAPRCNGAQSRCETDTPTLQPEDAPHQFACHYPLHREDGA